MKKAYLVILAVMLAGFLSAPAKAWRYGTEQKDCTSDTGYSYANAKNMKASVGYIAGMVETQENAASYKSAVDTFLKYWDVQSVESAKNLADCKSAKAAFDKYVSSMTETNAAAIKAYKDRVAANNAKILAAQEAARTPLTADQLKIKSDLEACVVKIKALKVSNDAMVADSNKLDDWNLKVAVSNAWDKVDKYLLAFQGTNSTIYTADNLKQCQDWANNTEVKVAYDAAKAKVGGKEACLVQLRALRVSNKALKDDADKNFGDQQKSVADAWAKVEKMFDPYLDHPPVLPSPDDLKNCLAVAANSDVQSAYDAGKKVLANRAFAALVAAEAKRKSDEAAALVAAEKQKVVDCKNGWRKRMADDASRMSELMWNGTVKQEDLIVYEAYHKDASAEYAAIIMNPLTLRECQLPSNSFDAMERYLAQLEARRQTNLAKEAAEAKKLEEQRKAEYERWLAAHPKDIPGACKTACTLRHNGPGPKETECERQCAVAKNAVVDAVNTAVDVAFLNPLETALDKLGVSKALCEAAQSKAGELMASASDVVDKLTGTVQEKSQGACTGSALKCQFVGRFLQTAIDAKACSDARKSLAKSNENAQKRIDTKKKFVADQKAKAAKGEKKEDSAVSDALKDTLKDSAEVCESPKASDLIANLVRPCTDAAEGAVWLAAHANDYRK